MKRMLIPILMALAALVDGRASAQILTARPQSVLMTASPDHNATTTVKTFTTDPATGAIVETSTQVPTVDGYDVTINAAIQQGGIWTAGAIAFTQQGGKPTPDATNKIAIPLSAQAQAVITANTVMAAIGIAKGPGGTAATAVDPFVWTQPQVPAAPKPPASVSLR